MSLFVTTDLRRLGRALPRTSDRKIILESAFQLLETFTGEESVWLPAFNYDLTSVGRGSYQPEAITTGALNTYIWHQKSEWKTQDPLFSLVGWGEKPKSSDLQASHLFPYGNGSIFEELINSNTQLLSFGSGISDGATFMHLVETNRPQGPVYRYWKTFRGVYDIDNQKINLTLTMHSRPVGHKLEYDLPRLNVDLIKNKIVEVIDQNLSIYLGQISNIYDFWLDRCTSNPYYLLTPEVAQNFIRIKEKNGRDFILEDFE